LPRRGARALLGWLALAGRARTRSGERGAAPRAWDRLADIVGALDVAAIGKLVGRPL